MSGSETGIQGKSFPDLRHPTACIITRSGIFDVLAKNEQSYIRIKEGHSPNDVLRFFIDQQSNISAFTELLPSLNEIFIKLVEGTSLSRQFQPIQS